MSPEQEEKLKEVLKELGEVIRTFGIEINELKKRLEALEKRGTDIKSVRFI